MPDQQRPFDTDEPRPPHPRPSFTLYPEERHWWSFNDYGAVLDTMRLLQPKRVLEFGPGSSTLALIEGGAAHIDTLEDNPDWAEVYETRLAGKYPELVRVHRYVWADPVTIPAIDGEHYDLALIDGPLGTDRRGAVVRYCLDHCDAVLAPTEDGNPKFRKELQDIAKATGWSIDIRETGPLSGGFALLLKPIAPSPPGEHSETTGGAPSETRIGENVVHPPLPDLQTPEEGVVLENPAVEPLESPPEPPLTNRSRRRRKKA